MARVNVTLDSDTYELLSKRAKQLGAAESAVARALLREALAHHQAAERRRRLAKDYAADRPDAQALLREIEAGQIELFDDQGS